MILSAYQNQLDKLDITKTASDLINENDARKHIFDKFNQWLASMYATYFQIIFGLLSLVSRGFKT